MHEILLVGLQLDGDQADFASFVGQLFFVNKYTFVDLVSLCLIYWKCATWIDGAADDEDEVFDSDPFEVVGGDWG